MQTDFIYEALPTRVIFGEGKLDQLAPEIERLGAKRALVLSTPQQEDWAQHIAQSLGQASAGVFAGATIVFILALGFYAAIVTLTPLASGSEPARLATLSVGLAEVGRALHRERRASYFQRIALAERAWSGNDVGRAEELLDGIVWEPGEVNRGKFVVTPHDKARRT